MNRPIIDWDSRASSRFSSPAHPFPVLYLARNRHTAFWEAFGEHLLDVRPQDRQIPAAMLAARRWDSFLIGRYGSVILLIESSWLISDADASTLLSPYVVTQQWSLQLMTHPAGIDGFWYLSRLNARERCLAIFGRKTLLDKNRPKARKGMALERDAALRAYLAREDIAIV